MCLCLTTRIKVSFLFDSFLPLDHLSQFNSTQLMYSGCSGVEWRCQRPRRHKLMFRVMKRQKLMTSATPSLPFRPLDAHASERSNGQIRPVISIFVHIEASKTRYSVRRRCQFATDHFLFARFLLKCDKNILKRWVVSRRFYYWRHSVTQHLTETQLLNGFNGSSLPQFYRQTVARICQINYILNSHTQPGAGRHRQPPLYYFIIYKLCTTFL